MRDNGASTMNARTVTESTEADANLFSLLSGRRVFPKRGGHGVGSEKSLPGTVHSSAGQYVSSVFDLAHNLSNRTMFVSSRQATQLVLRSYNRKTGGKDPYGVDDGTAKIDTFKIKKDDATAVGQWRDKIAKRPARLSVIELSGVLDEGLDGGFRGPKYQKAVRKAFQRVAAIRRSIHKQPEMQGRTLLVVTGTGGAQKAKGSSRTWAQSYRVPMWVTGPGVPAEERGVVFSRQRLLDLIASLAQGLLDEPALLRQRLVDQDALLGHRLVDRVGADRAVQGPAAFDDEGFHQGVGDEGFRHQDRA